MTLETQIKSKMTYTDISKYLYDTGLRLFKSTRGKPRLCELDHIWALSQLDYNNNALQQLYTLRYTYAYAFEYKEMYRIMLKDYYGTNYRPSLRIESIGCGNMVDGWSLFNVLNEKGREWNVDLEQIKYKGIDQIEWKNPLLTRGHFINIEAVKWFEHKNSLDSNVYMFPRSVGDFSDAEFERILRVFSTKRFSEETIYLMVSVRKRTGFSSSDAERAIELSRRIIRKGYKSKCLALLKDYDHILINRCDGTLTYPEEPKKYLTNLKHFCREFSEGKDSCVQCDIDNFPMLYADNLCFLIMKYER